MTVEVSDFVFEIKERPGDLFALRVESADEDSVTISCRIVGSDDHMFKMHMFDDRYGRNEFFGTCCDITREGPNAFIVAAQIIMMVL